MLIPGDVGLGERLVPLLPIGVADLVEGEVGVVVQAVLVVGVQGVIDLAAEEPGATGRFALAQ